jgi:hypothetical protein
MTARGSPQAEKKGSKEGNRWSKKARSTQNVLSDNNPRGVFLIVVRSSFFVLKGLPSTPAMHCRFFLSH